MPCNCDHLEPTAREAKLQRAAKLLVYVCKRMGTNPKPWMLKEAGNIYAKDERSVTELCAILKRMSPEQQETIIYDSRNKDARDLANWWEEHKAADVEREKEEAAEEAKSKLRKRALKKLSPAERESLDIE